MGRATASTEFAWLEPHNRAARRARVLFVVAIAICALYVLAFVGFVGLIIYEVDPGLWSYRNWSTASDLAAIAIGVSVVAIASIVAFAGWRGARTRSWGLVRASNTGPILVLRFEAEDAAELARLQDIVRAEIRLIEPSLSF